MPVLRTLFQRFIVSILVLLDHSLQADIASDFETQVMALQKQEQSRNAAVSIPEWMNTKKIEIHADQKNQWMDSAFSQALLPQGNQLTHLSRGFTGGDSLETDSLPSIRRFLDDVGVPFLVLPRVSNASPGQSVKFSNCVLGYWELGTLLVYPLQGVSVAANFFLGSITQLLVPEYDRPHPALVSNHSLDAVRGHCAFDQSVLPKGLEGLRRLLRKKFLLPSRLA